MPKTIQADEIQYEVRTFNEWLAGADIAYVGNQRIDTGDRLLRRRFNLPSHVSSLEHETGLDYGGRLSGGFWQTMRKTERHQIRIDVEPVVELDYGQIIPLLAYAEVGAVPECGDLYNIDGFQDHRPAVKKAVNALLFVAHPLMAWPKEIAEALPEGVTVKLFKDTFLSRHPALAPVIEKGIGYRLMNKESEVLCGVLRSCMDKGIVTLPIHDAVLCSVSSTSYVEAAMLDQAHRLSGGFIPVDVGIH